jgi:glycosyltransferase involved in cell wall biosynthesis
MRKKVAFVVQRCGLEVNGGAETHCFQVAQKMSKYWDVEVLTTCALDYMTWENYYSVGIEEVTGVKIRRFTVTQERIKKFNQLSEQIVSRLKEAPLSEQEKWMKAQGPWSVDLINYVKQNKNNYDIFIFFPYLYATTYFILPLVADKAYLAPLAHDEWTIYMSMWDSFFEKPQGFIFNTPEERNFLKKRFPKLQLNGSIVGVAVEPPKSYSEQNFRAKYNIHEPFLLYAGRIDPSKGCLELFNNFISLRSKESHPRKLVLIGKSTIDIPKHPDIIYIGFVDEQTKWDALAACDLLVMPSAYESLSIVLLEAWAVGKTVLVNGKCDVLVGQCRRSNAGLWYTNQDEFEVAIEMLSIQVSKQLGLQGKNYVENNYVWEKIENYYCNLIK